MASSFVVAVLNAEAVSTLFLRDRAGLFGEFRVLITTVGDCPARPTGLRPTQFRAPRVQVFRARSRQPQPRRRVDFDTCRTPGTALALAVLKLFNLPPKTGGRATTQPHSWHIHIQSKKRLCRGLVRRVQSLIALPMILSLWIFQGDILGRRQG